jgi:hypothetical protein
MATSSIFYLDAPSLSSATVVYSNISLTTVAPNGFYSDGSIVREQVDCVLLPQQSCPSCISGFSSSVMAATSNAACSLAETTTYYRSSSSNPPGFVGLNDLVFEDATGETPLAAGFYYAAGSITGGNEWFQVNASGVVITLGMCPATNRKYFATDCGTLNPRVLVIDGTPLTLGAVYRLTSETTSTCFTINTDEATSDPVTYIESSTIVPGLIAFELEPGGCESINCTQV